MFRHYELAHRVSPAQKPADVPDTADSVTGKGLTANPANGLPAGGLKEQDA